MCLYCGLFIVGTLASDIVRTLKVLKQLNGRIELHLVEASEQLRCAQSSALKAVESMSEEDRVVSKGEYTKTSAVTEDGIPVFWHRSVDELVGEVEQHKGDEPFNCLIAHEFFDALPVHQLVYREDKGWRERLVDIDDTGYVFLVLYACYNPLL